jgi:alpha-L-fucosidase
VDPAVVPFPGATGPGVTGMLQHGDPHGTVWRPGETDVSIRPGWFYHAAEDSKVKTVDQLVDLYFTSVGRNSKLLLNVPPTREGLLHSIDVERLGGMRTRLDALFARDLSPQVRAGREATISIAGLQEDIAQGQSAARYTLHGLVAGSWRVLSQGTTIGYRKLDRFQPVKASGVRLEIQETVGPALPVRIALYGHRVPG